MLKISRNYQLRGPISKATRRQNQSIFAADYMACAHYIQQESPAKCFHVHRRDVEEPIGFVWLALSNDEVPEHLCVHVDYVYVLPGEWGNMAKLLANKVFKRFRKWATEGELASLPSAQVHSSSYDATEGGTRFVEHLNKRLKDWCGKENVEFVGP